MPKQSRKERQSLTVGRWASCGFSPADGRALRRAAIERGDLPHKVKPTDTTLMGKTPLIERLVRLGFGLQILGGTPWGCVPHLQTTPEIAAAIRIYELGDDATDDGCVAFLKARRYYLLGRGHDGGPICFK